MKCKFAVTYFTTFISIIGLLLYFIKNLFCIKKKKYTLRKFGLRAKMASDTNYAYSNLLMKSELRWNWSGLWD